MKFSITNYFNGNMEQVIDSLMNEKLFPYLKENMKTMLSVELMEKEVKGDILKRKVKYQPVPLIEKIATKKIEPRWMTWVEETTFNKKTCEGTYENIPITEPIRERLIQKGKIQFFDEGGGKIKRILSGDLTIKFPIIGGIAERMIFKQAEKIIQEEAVVFAKFIETLK